MIILHSFGELAAALALPAHPDDANSAVMPEETAMADARHSLPDLEAIHARLRAATETLQAANVRDAAERADGLAALERYEALLARHGEANEACMAAHRLQEEARLLAERAFSDDCRAAAAQVAADADRAAVVATEILAGRRREVEDLGRTLDVPRLREARDRQCREREQREAAVEQTQRREALIAAVRRLLRAGRISEAMASFDPFAAEASSDSELAALADELRTREVQARVATASMALPAAFRELRRQPEAAVRRLEELVVDGLPEDLTRRIFGAWADGCARLCQARGIAAPLRYAPDPGRGLALIPDGTGGYVILSALGLGPRYVAGSPAPEHIVRRSHPLRMGRQASDRACA